MAEIHVWVTYVHVTHNSTRLPMKGVMTTHFSRKYLVWLKFCNRVLRANVKGSSSAKFSTNVPQCAKKYSFCILYCAATVRKCEIFSESGFCVFYSVVQCSTKFSPKKV